MDKDDPLWTRDGIWWTHPEHGTWTQLSNGQWRTPEHIEAMRRQRAATPVWVWLVLLCLGGCTVTACVAAPHIGWTGWGVIILVWYFARRLDSIEGELQSRNRD